MFIPSKYFKKEYDTIYKTSPEQANILLLLCEMADEKGRVEINEDELVVLFNIRFNSPQEYSF